MPTAAVKPALEKPAVRLTEAEALDILNSMPRLVATSNTALEPGVIVLVAYEVHKLKYVHFTFPEQPFCVLREISYDEYRLSLPPGLRAQTRQRTHFYEIHTD